MLRGAEPQAVLVSLQRPLQGTDLTAPEAAQDTGLQTARPQQHTICKGSIVGYCGNTYRHD